MSSLPHPKYTVIDKFKRKIDINIIKGVLGFG